MQWTNPWIELGVERGLERGIERGMDRGLREGRRREAAVLVLRQLRRRIGSLPAEVEDTIHALTLRPLESLGEALLDFKRPADLAALLRRHFSPKRG